VSLNRDTLREMRRSAGGTVRSPRANCMVVAPGREPGRETFAVSRSADFRQAITPFSRYLFSTGNTINPTIGRMAFGSPETVEGNPSRRSVA